MNESLQKKVDDILSSFIENLMDLQAVAIANGNRTEAKNIENLLKKIDL